MELFNLNGRLLLEEGILSKSMERVRIAEEVFIDKERVENE